MIFREGSTKPQGTTVLSVASGDSIYSVCPVFWLPSLFAPISMQYHVPMVTGIPGWPHLTTRSPWVIAVASHCPCLMHTHTHTFSYYFLRCHGVTSLLITALISCSNSAMCQLLAKCALTIAQVGHFSLAAQKRSLCRRLSLTTSLWSASPQSPSGRIAFHLLLSATAETKCSPAIWNC